VTRASIKPRCWLSGSLSTLWWPTVSSKRIVT